MFKAMHNLRTDRSTTNRLLNCATSRWTATSTNTCAACAMPKCPRWHARSTLLPTIEFAQQQTLVPEFDRLFKTLTAQQKEFWEEMAKPKASRRPALPRNIWRPRNALLDTLDKTVRRAGRRRQPPGRDDRPVAADQADRLAAAQHRRRSFAAGLERSRRRQGHAGSPARPNQARRRHRSRLERAATCRRRHAVAAGACRPRWPPPRPPISIRNISTARPPAERADHRREAGNDREPVEPDHGRPSRAPPSASPKPRSKPPRNIPPSCSILGPALADRPARAAGRRGRAWRSAP